MFDEIILLMVKNGKKNRLTTTYIDVIKSSLNIYFILQW